MFTRDRRDVVQASGDRPTHSLQGQYRGHQPHEERQYQGPDNVNNQHILSHDPNHSSNDNWDPHDDGRGHRINKHWVSSRKPSSGPLSGHTI